MATARSKLTDVLADDLAGMRTPDGGFGLARGHRSEAEPTAVAVLALDDERGRDWLLAAQRPDGGFADRDGRPESPSVSALAALALDDQRARQRALGHAVASRARMIGESGSGAHQGRDGWGWTADTYAWVEPTSRILLATKVVRPADTATRAEALALLRVRRCPDGGWNYGNASVNGVDLNAYAQTTAVALAALQGESPALIEPPLRFLRARWRSEPGGLTLAQTLIAFRLQGAEDEQELVDAIASTYRRTGFLGNVLALGWAVLATSPDGGLDRLRSSA